MKLLSNAIDQQGPWSGKAIQITLPWLIETLENKIQTIDWKHAAEDVVSFLRGPDRNTLELWGDQFFLDKIKNMQQYLD